MAEGRARAGGWTYLALALVALGVFVLVNRASSAPGPPAAETASPTVRTPLPDPPPFETTARPVASTRLAPRSTRGLAPRCDDAGCCPTRVSTFGTHAEITRVIASFQHRGFLYAAPPLIAPVSGDTSTGGTYLRWLGELPGDTASWRLVNVATGAVNHRTTFETVFQVSRADCGPGG